MSGSVSEWSKALVLGTSLYGGVGSNPTAAKFTFCVLWSAFAFFKISSHKFISCSASIIFSYWSEINCRKKIPHDKKETWLQISSVTCPVAWPSGLRRWF